MSEVNKNNLKIRKKIKILDNFGDYVGPWNYVSKIPRGTGCIAPKLRGHRLKGPKNPRAKVEGSKTLRGKYWRQICPAEFWTPQPVPRRVLDLSTCAPRSFGAMQPVPRGVLET